MPNEITLVDANVLLDIFTEDPRWFEWSAAALAQHAELGTLAINPIIYAEVSTRFADIEMLDSVLPETSFRRLPLPYNAGFLAAKAFLDYRSRGGQRTAPLPDFYIGAHAATAGYRLLTRDGQRYRTYFPRLDVIAP